MALTSLSPMTVDARQPLVPSQERQLLQQPCTPFSFGDGPCVPAAQPPALAKPGAECSMLPMDQLGRFHPQPSLVGTLGSMSQWWAGPCATLLAAATYASVADLAVQHAPAQPLQREVPAPTSAQASIRVACHEMPLCQQQTFLQHQQQQHVVATTAVAAAADGSPATNGCTATATAASAAAATAAAAAATTGAAGTERQIGISGGRPAGIHRHWHPVRSAGMSTDACLSPELCPNKSLLCMHSCT